MKKLFYAAQKISRLLPAQVAMIEHRFARMRADVCGVMA
jgi:hypothetical protein